MFTQKFSLFGQFINEYINKRQAAWSAAHSSKYVSPEQDEYPEYRSLVDSFESYMNMKRLITDHEAHTDTEYLLEWLDNECTDNSVKKYDKFLLLAQAVAKRGYKTAIDLPLTEDEFRYRKIIKGFNRWMQTNADLDKSHLENLLIWVDKESNLDDFTYQQFLSLAKIMAKNGYSTTIDLPMSETEFNDFFLKKYREVADELHTRYLLVKSRHGSNEFVSKFYEMAYAADLDIYDISPYQQSKQLNKMLHTESASIKAYYASSPGLFFQSSLLDNEIKNILSQRKNEVLHTFLPEDDVHTDNLRYDIRR